MIPKLRFPEFKEAWKKTTLGELAVFHDADRVPLESSVRKERKGIYPYYGASGIIDFVDDYLFNGEYILLAEDGANIINRSTPIAFLADGKFWVNNHAHILKATIKQSFVVHLLENQRYDKYNTGTAQPKLNRKVCESISLCLPQSDLEIDKISSLLDCVDHKINLLNKKKEALETYKKGLMQKIFTQELRFKREDGTDYPEWETFCIADLGEFFNGLTGKNSSHFGHGNSQYVQYSQVFRNSYIKLDECDNVDVEDSDKQNALKVGDALFTTSSEVADEVAFASILLNKPEIDTYLNSFCFGLRLNSLLAPSFAQYLFRTKFFRKAVYPLAQGSTRYNVSKKEVGKVQMRLPSVEEQNRIAELFQLLDSRIDSVVYLIKKTEQLKKGLLQRMFA